MVDVTEDSLERLYDKIHLEEINRGGRMGEIRLRVVRRFNQEAGLTAQSAELEALRGEVAPVRHWYESDEHSPRSDVDILKDIVADLQSDRAENLKLRARVAALEGAAAKVLPFNVENGPDYASVYFGDGSTHSTQAMTMNPQDWLDLEAALRALLNHNGEA